MLLGTALRAALALAIAASHATAQTPPPTRPDALAKWLENDPVGRSAAAVERGLRRHAFFSNVDYEIHYAHAPFIFFLQRPPKDRDDYARAVINKNLPYLQKLESMFVRDFVGPAQLTRNPELQCYAIAVLASRGSYDDYARAVRSGSLHSSEAHYDPQLRLAVTYWDFGKGTTQQHPILHEFVHALQHAYYGGKGEPMPRPIWFTEGLAEFRTHVRNQVQSLEEPQPSLQHLFLYAEMLAQPRYRFLCNPLQALVTIDGPGYAAIPKLAFQRSGTVGDERLADFSITVFYAQAHLFVHWLYTAEEGRYRPAFLAYTQRVMRGEVGWDPFRESFAAHDVDALEREFQKYCLARRDDISGVDSLSAGARADMQRKLAAATVKAGADAPYDTSALALAATDPARLAWALALAHEGRYAEAIAALPPAAEDARVAREHARLSALAKFRTDVLEHAKASKKSLRLELPGGRKAHGTLVDFTDQGFRLQFSPTKTFDVAHADLTPEVLDQIVAKTGMPPGSEWIAGYRKLLAGQPVTARDVAGDSDAARGLREDLGGFAAIRASGAVAAKVGEVATALPAGDRAAAARSLAALTALVKQHGADPLVQARMAALRDYARVLLVKAFDASDAATLGVHGAFERIGAEGRFRLKYDFTAMTKSGRWMNLDDFALIDGRLEFQRTRPVVAATQIATDGESVRVTGTQCRALSLPFSAPFRVRYRVKFEDPNFALGVCDRSPDAGIACFALGTLIIQDHAAGLNASIDSSVAGVIGKLYEFELEHDGTDKLACKIDGKVVTKAQNLATLKRGQLYLWWHANNPIHILSIEIEGLLTDEDLDACRTRWVDARFAELFGK